MTEELVTFLSHPVRRALLELLRERGTVTSTVAARELGGASGLYSFHLRQLARHGVIEEAPAPDRRARPWRLAGADSGADPAAPGAELNRALEDESYQRWLATRAQAPARWRLDEAFSEVLYLTPTELAALGAGIRALTEEYRHRDTRPAARPAGAGPVAVVSRLFPLIDP